MRKILFPTDFSIPANNAFLYAVALAKDLGAKINILHVYSNFFIPSLGVKRKAFLETKSNEIQSKINELIKTIPENLFDEQYVVFGTFVAAEIADEAEDDYDLIVMGMKGEHQRLDKWMGSVTTNLMMKSPCPVLAIPEKATYKGINKITLATSLPTSKDFPIQHVSAFAKALSAKLEFVTVDNIVRKAKKYQPNQPKTVFFGKVYDIVINPSIPEGLNDFILKNKSDILSLYMQKRQLWERLFHISVSKEMAFHTKVPLFVFHE